MLFVRACVSFLYARIYFFFLSLPLSQMFCHADTFFIVSAQYVSVLVVILVLVLSRIFKGTTVSYTELKPTYEKYLELSNSDDVLNMKCTVANDTLTYNAFTTFSYEKADACTWVEADLEKARPAKTDVNYTVYTNNIGNKVEEPLTRRDLLEIFQLVKN